tara:strand:- start:434 stop:1600 length:1167 start_codon:yes stop_codon:yes gene_type:complete
MAGPQTRGGRGNVGARHKFESSEHWKYPETIGSDTSVDDITFNSHATSQYAIKRMSNISEATHEPFMMFEFMKVDNENYGKDIAGGINATIDYAATSELPSGQRVIEQSGELMTGGYNAAKNGIVRTYDWFTGEANNAQANTKAIKSAGSSIYNQLEDWAKSLGTLVKRKYSGSICLYMPTDIQINDQMVYNEDSRKMGAFVETFFDNKDELFNATTLTSQTALTAAGYLGGMVPGVNGIFSALAGAGLSQVVGNEIQRGSGKIANPNEILMYQSTAMRTFTFSYTILPDSVNESKQAAGLIKMFRKAAHATKDNKTLITVPDHVIVSFHGAKDMIQLPPCVIESVGVTYNPNSSSFFKENNAPVEIGLSIALKEMAPIYSGDVEAGY